jgi:cation diffusion facilitator CzcD-associated flavoprotein CzcO
MPRDTTERSTRVAVIGAGAGGLALGALLRRAGVDDFVIFEKSDGVGGTWRVNTYPGAECDVPSHLYSFSFLLNPAWSKTFAGQPEILAYLEHCADVTGLRPHLRTSTAVESVSWDGTTRRWSLRTEHGDTWQAQVVVSAVGLFNAPAWPDLPGLDSFAGPVMHSARWDHGVELSGKRVGVIGTGASAIQVVPAIAGEVSHLDVYQRSSPWIVPRGDEPFTPQDKARFEADAMAARRQRHAIYRFYEGNTMVRSDDPMAAKLERYALAHLEASVADPGLRARLTPDYPIGCKRVLLSDDYYPTLLRPDVELVTDAIERVVPEGIVTAGGVVHPLDVIVAATGFRAVDYLHGVEVVGRDGRRLHDDWASEPRAYLGMAVPGYPNFFVFYGPNTNQGGNSILLILEAQARYVVQLLAVLERTGVDALEVSTDAFDDYNLELDHDLEGTVWTACANYFRTASGHIATQLPHPASWYRRRARRVRVGDYVPVD